MREIAQRPRSAALDAVRVMSIIAIVAGHAWTRDRTALAVYPWHVPVFFFLTGYLWSGRRSLEDEARRRLSTLGRPYVFWLIVLAVPTVVLIGSEADERISGALRGGTQAIQPFTTFWFVSVLLATTLLFRGSSQMRV